MKAIPFNPSEFSQTNNSKACTSITILDNDKKFLQITRAENELIHAEAIFQLKRKRKRLNLVILQTLPMPSSIIEQKVIIMRKAT